MDIFLLQEKTTLTRMALSEATNIGYLVIALGFRSYEFTTLPLTLMQVQK